MTWNIPIILTVVAMGVLLIAASIALAFGISTIGIQYAQMRQLESTNKQLQAIVEQRERQCENPLRASYTRLTNR